jgi:hypothetical protein
MELPQRTRTKTVQTEIGPVEIDVPRGTGSTLDPQIVKKGQRRLLGGSAHDPSSPPGTQVYLPEPVMAMCT